MSRHYHSADVSQDPIGSEGRSSSQRKHSRDGNTLTPSEQHLKNQLMNQFRRTGEGPGGNSDAFKGAACWCFECSRHLRAENSFYCEKCHASREAEMRMLHEDSGLTVDEFATLLKVQ